VRQRATFAPGEIACYPELSGWEQLEWFLAGRPRAALRRGRDLMERLKLPGHKRLREYSHGMKRQLMIAAALAPDVPVRILDEPTEGLDPTKRGEVLALLAEDAGPGRTLLLSSHHLGEVDRGCARLLFLNQGRLIADERAAELAERARRLVRLCFPLLDLSRDLVQSVCRELIEQRDKFEFQGDAAFRNWLYTAALRKVVERSRHWNAAKRDVERESVPEADDAPVADAYATVTTPSLVARRREDLAAFEAAFDDLTEEHREVVTLAKLVGLSHAEIAVKLGRTEEACRQLLRRALVRLELALERRGLGGE